MSRYTTLFLLGVLPFGNCINSPKSQAFTRKDSIRIGIQQIFPLASKIDLTDSGGQVGEISYLSGWSMRASVSERGDSAKTYFYFYHLRDSIDYFRLLRETLEASERLAATPGHTHYNYSLLPFVDLHWKNAMVYRTSHPKEFLEYIDRAIIMNLNFHRPIFGL